jgi:hypothetical protein
MPGLQIPARRRARRVYRESLDQRSIDRAVQKSAN